MIHTNLLQISPPLGTKQEIGPANTLTGQNMTRLILIYYTKTPFGGLLIPRLKNNVKENCPRCDLPSTITLTFHVKVLCGIGYVSYYIRIYIKGTTDGTKRYTYRLTHADWVGASRKNFVDSLSSQQLHQSVQLLQIKQQLLTTANMLQCTGCL